MKKKIITITLTDGQASVEFTDLGSDGYVSAVEITRMKRSLDVKYGQSTRQFRLSSRLRQREVPDVVKPQGV